MHFKLHYNNPCTSSVMFCAVFVFSLVLMPNTGGPWVPGQTGELLRFSVVWDIFSTCASCQWCSHSMNELFCMKQSMSVGVWPSFICVISIVFKEGHMSCFDAIHPLLFPNSSALFVSSPRINPAFSCSRTSAFLDHLSPIIFSIVYKLASSSRWA